MLSSPASNKGRASAVADPGRRAVGPDVVLDPLQQGGLARWLGGAASSPCVSALPRTSCISRASRPHDASSGLRASAAVRSSRRGRCLVFGTHVRLQALPERGRRVEKEEVDSASRRRWRPGRRGSSPAGGSSRTARDGPGGPAARALPAGGRRRSSGAPPGSAGRCEPAVAARVPSARLILHRGVVRPQPNLAPCRAGARRNDRRGPRRAARWRSARAARAFPARPGPAWRPHCRCASASGASQGSSKCCSTTSMRGHTDRSGIQGSAFGSLPVARASAPETNVPGNGKATLAHTPSCAPGVTPRRAERR